MFNQVMLNIYIRAAAAEPKTCSSSLHKVKGFADDLTVISSNVDLHQVVLKSLVLKAGDICFEFQSVKCVSLHFNGRRVVSTTQFSMNTGNTNICSINCTKFLGKAISVSLSATCKLVSDIMKQQILMYLQCIDDCSIRGEVQGVDPKEFCDICPSFSHCYRKTIYDVYSGFSVINVKICEVMVKPSS